MRPWLSAYSGVGCVGMHSAAGCFHSTPGNGIRFLVNTCGALVCGQEEVRAVVWAKTLWRVLLANQLIFSVFIAKDDHIHGQLMVLSVVFRNTNSGCPYYSVISTLLCS